jgi:tRNASer (uridine44-2'-O)-methyltransferase
MQMASDEPMCIKHKFEPYQVPDGERPGVMLPDDSWHYSLECRCTFTSEVFTTVMLNLIKNPNITSSHLFRADILHDSDGERASGVDQSDTKVDVQPINAQWQGFEKIRTIVRRLIPRNPQLDKSLVQTCHFFRTRALDGADANHAEPEKLLILYIPHVDTAEDMPFYHPAVSQLAFLYEQTVLSASEQPQNNSITILYRLFPQSTLDNKLSRTALRLLQTIHKHGQGILAGYEKRVHLDQLIPQKQYQDTYTALKIKYGKQLADQWVEVTDPGKHVFEDIAIAAYLIELWRGMYKSPVQTASTDGDGVAKPAFPGFVDIGCGNGILVHILLSEGYQGCGFDARERKTWTIFPESTRERLERRILVPDVLQLQQVHEDDHEETSCHNGVFHDGEFIISNHADELTAWTPLLAHLSNSAFIVIPCCSHNLSGARFRAPKSVRPAKEERDGSDILRLPQQETAPAGADEVIKSQAAETGSLKKTDAQKKMPSAYATLCSYVASLAEAVNFAPEQDVLRIPSTRNQCIVGRNLRHEFRRQDLDSKRERIIKLVETETKSDIATVSKEWIDRASKLMLKPASGH